MTVSYATLPTPSDTPCHVRLACGCSLLPSGGCRMSAVVACLTEWLGSHSGNLPLQKFQVEQYSRMVWSRMSNLSLSRLRLAQAAETKKKDSCRSGSSSSTRRTTWSASRTNWRCCEFIAVCSGISPLFANPASQIRETITFVFVVHEFNSVSTNNNDLSGVSLKLTNSWLDHVT